MKPILFNAEMVRAILDGRKTQTRRVVKPRHGGHLKLHDDVGGVKRLCERDGSLCRGLKPPYEPGDILWVRETWREEFEYSGTYDRSLYFYKASDPEYTGQWSPSIHMPKEAARIFLRVTDVRVERLHDITNADALREGASEKTAMDVAGSMIDLEPWQDFMQIWENTIKPADRDRYGWDADPWVWVYTFKRCGKEGESWNG
jgi:hypothetical protein